jgi:serine protease AprX
MARRYVPGPIAGLVTAVMLLASLAPVAAAWDRPAVEGEPGTSAVEHGDPSVPVPASSRPWLVALHERGRPYPPDLLPLLLGLGPEEPVGVLVQFRDGTDGADLGLMETLGLRVAMRFVGVDACYVRGQSRAVWDLLRSGRTWYVEPERPLAIDMDISTAVINATRVWATQVAGVVGPGALRIDGNGVTVVVVDTGIDAGHPDLDYGQKVLFNLRSDTGDAPYYEIENSDLGYGHGTHVAGTVAGNGDASAGARRGVAPGANLIGITIDTQNSVGYVGALDWVYRNSRPWQNPYNIRAATNSWHTTVEEYDPQQAISVLINALAHENNVVSTWSAGNDGENDPEGNELTTSGQGNTPAGIMVAAYTHDGAGVTTFSSRGRRGAAETYPDIGAPGLNIWSCSARRTVISGGSYIGGNDNPYYLAISGTSMSTPHVAGLVALLWQAAPSLQLSWKHEDHSGDPGDWFERDDTRIHEAEWILESTATFLEGKGLGANGIPERDDELDGFGVDGEPIDYVQGYGIVNAERAVAVALALQRLRSEHPGENITVADALKAYAASLEGGEVELATDTLSTSWAGEYSRYNDQLGKPYAIQNQTHLLWVPDGTEEVELELRYSALSIEELTAGTVTWTVDFGFDGSIDRQGPLGPAAQGVRRATISASEGGTGAWWAFSVLGEGFRLQRPRQDINYVEVRIEYSMGVWAHMTAGQGAVVVTLPDGYYVAMAGPWVPGEPTASYAGGTVAMATLRYNISRVVLDRSAPPSGPTGEGGGVPMGWLAAALLIVAVTAVLAIGRRAGPGEGTRFHRLARAPARAVGAVTARLRRRRTA